jgi:pimeloyl-ACP methyl ester carboxylesterase
MPRAHANGIELEYSTLGDSGGPPLVLIMGLGAQLIDWPAGFCTLLADEGFYVICFDNRDAGLSTGFDHLGDRDEPAYYLTDMADDTVGLCDALGLDRVHLVGQSLGGMIAQQVAISHQDRLRSLCSLSSTTGDLPGRRGLPILADVRPSAGLTRAEAVARGVADARRMGSPGFPAPSEAQLIARFAAKYDRAYHPAGRARQLAAIEASGNRTAGLGTVRVPTVVIHGDADARIDVSAGRATAAAIPGADLVIVPGMGHGIPDGAIPQVVAAIVANARRA